MFENIWITIPLIFIIKKTILPNSFIKDRLEFFANSIAKNYIDTGTFKKEKIEEIKKADTTELKEELIESLEQISLEEEKQNKENTYKTYAENIKEEKIEKVKEEIIEKPSKLSLAISKFFSENLLAKLG
jgi:methionine salvage enolase-phosphatase E1